MKNKIQITLSVILALYLGSCQDEDLRVHYPKSNPVYDSVYIAEDAIVYGDSITLNVGVSDKKTPLSTLEIKVVVNDEIISSESVRTKGNSATYKTRYQIPFIAHMPDDAEVEVHLSSINVEGYKTDTILFNTIASRPVISSVWLVSATRSIELTLTDANNYIYSAEGLTLANEVSFRLATKVNKFKKIDWTGLVFGSVDGKIGLIDINGESLKLSDATLIGFNKITLDLYNFTIVGDGEKLVPATVINLSSFQTISMKSTNHLGTATTEDWKTTQLYLGKDVNMTLTGLSNPANTMSPDFFEATGTNTVKFLGETGVYTLYYLPSADYLYIEKPAAVYPEALWLCGVGFGRPSIPYTKTASWNWNTPQEYSYCRKIAPGIFQTTIYVEHEADNNFGDNLWRHQFSVKFFHQRGWGTNAEESALNYTMPALLVAQPDGNWGGADALTTAYGVYRMTVNLNTMVTTFVKVN